MMDLANIALAVLCIAGAIVIRTIRRRLAALRRNAFVTNEKGHRVRYVDAPAAVRARAEK